MSKRRFTGEYAQEGKQIRYEVRAAAGHRCIRCGHPFESGKHGKGEWSPCDERCSHKGAIRISSSGSWIPIVSNATAGDLVKSGDKIEAQWRILTVHHFDGDKANDAWWNTLALCQRCHLQIQTTVDPRIPFFLEHSEWIKPFVAGLYAWHYEGVKLTREQVMDRINELLNLATLKK